MDCLGKYDEEKQTVALLSRDGFSVDVPIDAHNVPLVRALVNTMMAIWKPRKTKATRGHNEYNKFIGQYLVGYKQKCIEEDKPYSNHDAFKAAIEAYSVAKQNGEIIRDRVAAFKGRSENVEVMLG